MNLRLPSITGQTEAQQLRQLKRYLYQLVEELNWTLEAAPAHSAPASSPSAPDAAASFPELKSLIIRSADIVDSYTEKIGSRLEEVYVARSDFGTYREQTAQTLEETAANVRRSFSQLQSIQSQLEGIESTLIGVDAYLNSGLLYYDGDGVPVYGIEVGQRTQVEGQTVFNKYARFTAGKLSFYDANDNEVAYISDYKLFITNVEISGTLRQGHLEDSALADGSLVTRYIPEGGNP